MIERLFSIDDTEAGRTAVGGQRHPVADALAYKTGATLAFVQFAVAWTQVALDTAVVVEMPVSGGVVWLQEQSCRPFPDENSLGGRGGVIAIIATGWLTRSCRVAGFVPFPVPYNGTGESGPTNSRPVIPALRFNCARNCAGAAVAPIPEAGWSPSAGPPAGSHHQCPVAGGPVSVSPPGAIACAGDSSDTSTVDARQLGQAGAGKSADRAAATTALSLTSSRNGRQASGCPCSPQLTLLCQG